MKILDRYIFQQFVKTFVFTTITFVSLFILINMVENLGDFMDRKLLFTDIVLYYLRAIPETILITSPVSSLLASILVAGRLAGSSELPAIRSAGVSMRQLLYPFLLGGIIISTLNILNSFWLAPIAAVHNHAFERDHLGKSRRNGTAEGSNLHIIEPGSRVVTIGRLNTSFTGAKEVSIEEFSGTGLRGRIDAESMRYDTGNKEWTLQNAAQRRFTPSGEEYQARPALSLPLSLTLKSLAELNLRPDEMQFIQHWQYLAEKKHAGFAGLERTMVKLHTKIAVPFASLIIILIGVPLSAKKKRGGLATEIGISLFAGFLFLGLQKTIATFGYNGVVNPMLAAWLPNLLFLAIGYGIYRYSPD